MDLAERIGREVPAPLSASLAVYTVLALAAANRSRRDPAGRSTLPSSHFSLVHPGQLACRWTVHVNAAQAVDCRTRMDLLVCRLRLRRCRPDSIARLVGQGVDALVDRLMTDTARPPVIILQADRGHRRFPGIGNPPPLREADPVQAAERTDIFAADHMPQLTGSRELLRLPHSSERVPGPPPRPFFRCSHPTARGPDLLLLTRRAVSIHPTTLASGIRVARCVLERL